MKEIRRTLGDLKNKVIDAEQKDAGTSYLIPIEVTPQERERMAIDVCGDLIVAFCKRIAEKDERTDDWGDEAWDDFYDRCHTDIVLEASFMDFERSMDACEAFVNNLERDVDKIIESMATKMYEVEVTLTYKVTVPVLARNAREAESWVEDMSAGDIHEYEDDFDEVWDTEVGDVDETNNSPDDYRNYEDAT